MNINFSKKGEGEQILILHGWGSSIKSWAKTQEDLANLGYEAIVFDFPGFGESDPPPESWTSTDYLNWLLGFIADKKIKTPITVVGHSFGGGIAMKLAIERPELVKKLILVSAARAGNAQASLKVKAIKSLSKIKNVLARLPFFDAMREIFYKVIVREKDYYRTRGVMRETMTKVIKENLTPSIHKIKAPTLIIWGDKDASTPVENARIINQKIESSKLRIIPGAGHAVNLERPHELAQLIHDFTKSV